jgi:hypothetical protein
MIVYDTTQLSTNDILEPFSGTFSGSPEIITRWSSHSLSMKVIGIVTGDLPKTEDLNNGPLNRSADVRIGGCHGHSTQCPVFSYNHITTFDGINFILP